METVKSGSEKEESKDLSGKILVTDSIATEFKSISIIEAMGSEHNEGTSFPPSKPRLCVNGCGFFGMASNTNLCSKCYRDLRAGEEQAVQVKATMEKSLRVKTKKEGEVLDLSRVGSFSTIVEQQPAVVIADHKPTELKAANRCFIKTLVFWI
ncbi:hypothetical protein V6N11_052319 [Hibiscus sabdariffa]|uniref:A20-type domain-containing protein n=1 Tax=Hibiscus sabdariffa TaxID=183260 RepID=A0ABR2UAE5_9ROSI